MKKKQLSGVPSFFNIQEALNHAGFRLGLRFVLAGNAKMMSLHVYDLETSESRFSIGSLHELLGLTQEVLNKLDLDSEDIQDFLEQLVYSLRQLNFNGV